MGIWWHHALVAPLSRVSLSTQVMHCDTETVLAPFTILPQWYHFRLGQVVISVAILKCWWQYPFFYTLTLISLWPSLHPQQNFILAILCWWPIPAIIYYLILTDIWCWWLVLDLVTDIDVTVLTMLNCFHVTSTSENCGVVLLV